MTTASFADYVAQQDARNTIQLNVTKWTLMLCDVLRQNYIDYSIRQHQHSLEHLDNISDAEECYHLARIEELKQGICDYDFTFESGRKYHKVIMHTENQRSVHCFIDKKTGQIYKSASWKSPAKGVRYDLRLIKDREYLLEHATWCGGYLYAR